MYVGLVLVGLAIKADSEELLTTKIGVNTAQVQRRIYLFGPHQRTLLLCIYWWMEKHREL